MFVQFNLVRIKCYPVDRSPIEIPLDFFNRHEVFLYSISQIAFPLFGNRLHITGTKMNRQILNTHVNK